MIAIMIRSGFNPRPRGGGDSMMMAIQTMTAVSIHAPAGGATSLRSESA